MIRNPLRDATTKAVSDFLKTRVFHTFGVPEVVVSDNGKQFISAEMKALLKQYNVKAWRTSKYHPQANAVEATNKTVETAIRAYLNEDKSHTEWDKYLSEITCSMNTAVHTSTKQSPYFVNFGHNMILSGDTHALKTPQDESIFRDITRLKKIRDLVKENLAKSYDVRKKRYDLRTRPIQYQIGDTVWRRNFIQSNAIRNICANIAPNFIKSKILKKLGSNSYELADLAGKSVGIYSTQDIKPNDSTADTN